MGHRYRPALRDLAIGPGEIGILQRVAGLQALGRRVAHEVGRPRLGFRVPPGGMSWEDHERSCLLQALDMSGGNPFPSPQGTIAATNLTLDATTAILLYMGLYQLRYLSRIPPHAAVMESVELAKRSNKIRAVRGVGYMVPRQP